MQLSKKNKKNKKNKREKRCERCAPYVVKVTSTNFNKGVVLISKLRKFTGPKLDFQFPILFSFLFLLLKKSTNFISSEPIASTEI